jgi:hypothetical protein
MLQTAFPSLAKNLTPIAAAHGLEPLVLPDEYCPKVLGTSELIELTISGLIAPLDVNEYETLLVHFDAEWNVSRTVGVSVLQIAPQMGDTLEAIYLIPVSDNLIKTIVYSSV